MTQNDSDRLNDNTTGRFAVNQVSESTTVALSASHSTHQPENFEVMSGNVSSTVSSGGNNTPYVEGTPTSTVHSQLEIQTDRYFNYIWLV